MDFSERIAKFFRKRPAVVTGIAVPVASTPPRVEYAERDEVKKFRLKKIQELMKQMENETTMGNISVQGLGEASKQIDNPCLESAMAPNKIVKPNNLTNSQVECTNKSVLELAKAPKQINNLNNIRDPQAGFTNQPFLESPKVPKQINNLNGIIQPQAVFSNKPETGPTECIPTTFETLAAKKIIPEKILNSEVNDNSRNLKRNTAPSIPNTVRNFRLKEISTTELSIENPTEKSILSKASMPSHGETKSILIQPNLDCEWQQYITRLDKLDITKPTTVIPVDRALTIDNPSKIADKPITNPFRQGNNQNEKIVNKCATNKVEEYLQSINQGEPKDKPLNQGKSSNALTDQLSIPQDIPIVSKRRAKNKSKPGKTSNGLTPKSYAQLEDEYQKYINLPSESKIDHMIKNDIGQGASSSDDLPIPTYNPFRKNGIVTESSNKENIPYEVDKRRNSTSYDREKPIQEAGKSDNTDKPYEVDKRRNSASFFREKATQEGGKLEYIEKRYTQQIGTSEYFGKPYEDVKKNNSSFLVPGKANQPIKTLEYVENFKKPANSANQSNKKIPPQPVRKRGMCLCCSESTFDVCANCGRFYCSTICQTIDWPKHFRICAKIPDLVSSDIFYPATSNVQPQTWMTWMNIGDDSVPSNKVKETSSLILANGGTPRPAADVGLVNPFRNRKDQVDWVTGSNVTYGYQAHVDVKNISSSQANGIDDSSNANNFVKTNRKPIPNETELVKPSTPEASKLNDIPIASVCEYPLCEACVLPSVI